MPRGSRKVVHAAIATNLVVTIAKFIVAALSGSAAMLAEAFHSSADTVNEILILVGLKRSEKPPEELYPFGHGRELYFWAFIVAMCIFAVGGGLSVFEGVYRFMHPAKLEDPKWNYVVLGVAAATEGYSWLLSFRELRRRRRERESLLQTIHRSHDPSVFTVFVEDTTALIGLSIAFLGVFLSHRFQAPRLDAVASILIGVLLALAATILAFETGSLLLGESVDRETFESVRRIISEDKAVERLGKVLTMQLGPEEVLLAADVRFNAQLGTADLEQAIDRIENAIRQRYPEIKRLYFEAETIGGKDPSQANAA